ncbi:DUF817 family protein [bacterium]|nr:MAG: DUF817 family protein [bacterium]
MRALLAFFTAEAEAGLFGWGVFAGLALSHLPLPIARYDFLLLWCLGLQAWMMLSGRERGREIAIVAAFHLLGLGLEMYKVRYGSWSYPESAVTKVLDVPLYSGFMYASVASYMMNARRTLNLRFHGVPAAPMLVLGTGAIYANFLLARRFGDVRGWILAGLALLLWPMRVEFDWNRKRTRMPILVALTLIGFFVFLAENVCTALGAWVYPHQAAGWQPVEMGKIVSWILMSTVALLVITLMGGFGREAARRRRPVAAV